MSQLKIGIKALVGLLTIVFAFGALNAHAQSDAQNSITGVAASNGGNGTIVLKVDLAQPLANVPNGFTINTPPRIAFDFTNATNGLTKSAQDINEGDLRSVNLIQAGTRTRLVINLNQMVTYETKAEGSSLLITLHPKLAAAAESASVSRFAAANASEQKHTLRDIDFRRGKNGEGRVQIDLSDASTGIDIRQQGSKLIVDYIKTSLPHNLQRRLDVTDFATPVQSVDTFAKGDNVQMVIEPKGLWEYAAYQTDNKFIVEIKPVVEDPNKLVKSSQIGYAGEKLTLDFQNIAVREALNVIADFTNLNVVISDSVTGNLTLRLKDVPWDQALDIILQSRGLDMRKNGNVIQVAPREELAAKEKIELTARQEISELEDLKTETFQLNYIKGDAFKKIVTDPQQKLLSKRGSAVWDERTNQIFVQDTPSKLDEVRKIIAKVDVPVRQVMIEARVVEASDQFSRNLGVNMTYTNTNIPITPAAPPGVIGAAGGAGVATAGVVAPIGGPAGTITAMLFNASNTRMLNLQLQALDTDSKGKIISSPRVVTADKTEATIETGVQIPYQQASSSGATNVAFVTAALSLKVKPQITPDDNVLLDVKVNKDSVGTIYAGVPSINTNKVNTQVLVENGGTVVIGGVYTQTKTDADNKVPFLGDIPVLGYLFKSTSAINNKDELLVFITPKVMKDTLNLK
ncbi:MAG: type IV pilus secretin PilQ [Gallionella sp.]|nr:type IV pilus secretin PilQ [Gallionella sp.]